MQFRDLNKQYQTLKPEIDKALLDTVASGAFIMGKPVKELEASLAEYVGVKHCISCGNGTDALTLALKTWNIGTGDAVFVSDFTFFASAEVISLQGATPVFVDVEANTFNMDPECLRKVIETTIKDEQFVPRAIITVDLFGLPANYQAIREIADQYDLLTLEDGAQGFGGSINGKRACSFGDISTTSFFPAKPLGCYGDGGAVFTNNDQWATIMDSLRVHGKGSFKYDNVRIGVNSRLDTIQAAILLPKFEAFKAFELDRVNEAARLYSEKLNGIVKIPFIPEGYYSSWAQYTITLRNREERDGLQAFLKEKGIPSMVYYPTSMHAQTAFANLGYEKEICSVSRMLSDKVLSLPMHPYITAQEVDLVCKVIRKFLK